MGGWMEKLINYSLLTNDARDGSRKAMDLRRSASFCFINKSVCLVKIIDDSLYKEFHSQTQQ